MCGDYCVSSRWLNVVVAPHHTDINTNTEHTNDMIQVPLSPSKGILSFKNENLSLFFLSFLGFPHG